MRPKIVLFGDSITEESFGEGGWGAALASHFSRTADVVLRGYSGYNSRWAVHVLEKVFASLGDGEGKAVPKAVTVFFGANDACLPDRSSAFQHVPIHEYEQNLHKIVSFIKKLWPTALVLLITPPPIDEDGRLRYPYGDNLSGLPERTNEFAGSYAKACVAVAGELGVPMIDVWSKMQQFPGWEKACLRDGLHLTASGNRIVFEEVVEKLKQESLSLETLALDLPLFFDIDAKDPLKTFRNSDGPISS
ncbi:SGNH hydrolase-type esterase superfamily protein [Tasmannia lanceolata]|uniref:SGNH hydrolase-type esterase superfamily protein n=1 Tax=Tasmannia lanceolata TaxID=3420 RepID=UPI0040641EFE